MEKTTEKYQQGKTYLIAIEWDTCEEQEPEDWDESASGAYEFGEAVAFDELIAAKLGAIEEAKDLLDSNGSGWVSVLIGIGECVDDVDIENAIEVITFEA